MTRSLVFIPAFALLLSTAGRDKMREKPAGGVSNTPVAAPPRVVATTGPFTGRLALSPEYQWLGAGGDGGGIRRATLAVAAMSGDDPATARKLAALADQTPPPRTEAESVDFSGISDWIARSDDLPPVAKASLLPWFYEIESAFHLSGD